MKRRPLSGKTVVVTRPKDQARALARALKAAGARVVAAPLIRIAPPSSFQKLDLALKRLEDYDGVLFTSRNAVESFFSRAKTLRLKLGRPKKLYAIGPETAGALDQRGWRGARQPKVSRGEWLARALGPVRGLKLLIPRAKVAREILPRLLRSKGARVSVVEAYRTVADRDSMARLKKECRDVSAVTFASGSTVNHFFSLLGWARGRGLFKTAKAVAIGPVTALALRRHGIEAAQAKTATAAALARAVVDALS